MVKSRFFITSPAESPATVRCADAALGRQSRRRPAVLVVKSWSLVQPTLVFRLASRQDFVKVLGPKHFPPSCSVLEIHPDGVTVSVTVVERNCPLFLMHVTTSEHGVIKHHLRGVSTSVRWRHSLPAVPR